MDRRVPPVWRETDGRCQFKPPISTIPRKRPAETDAQEAAWVAGEDRFVLEQAKKRAVIKVKSGRAKPIDWLAVTLRIIDPTRNFLDEDDEDDGIDVVDPESVFEGLNLSQLVELETDIDTYVTLETNGTNRDFWNTMQTICKDRQQSLKPSVPKARGVSAITSDVDNMFGNKSHEELEAIEKKIREKLGSNEPIDVDYWEHLLRRLLVWKAKVKLRRVSEKIINSRLEGLRKLQQEEAYTVQNKLHAIIGHQPAPQTTHDIFHSVSYFTQLDPEPLLKLRLDDKSLELLGEPTFLSKVTEHRRRVLKMGFVPMRQKDADKLSVGLGCKVSEGTISGSSRFSSIQNDDFSQATTALYEREVARGVNEDEEIFTREEDVPSVKPPLWANKYRPRKPRYFNRVQMGYEWNKYNQTHYDHDNPPPKVVQGYKFNIFYPDLIDRTKAPTYRIEREHGRKRGQSFAPAGEEDTCLIRFTAGPPYEDIAFRIVDKEWDYSAKRDRGFKSSFDKGILQLHFQFKKIYYRK